MYEVCDAIWIKLAPIFMPHPTKSTWENNERHFKAKWNFPNCVGAIDGKHVVFEKPANSGSLFFNYKKTFSIVLLAVMDADYKFIMIDVGSAGKNSDGGIFSHSNFGKRMVENRLNFPPDKVLPGTNITVPYVIVGDEAFPLQRNLMRPYPSSELPGNNPKKIYNYRLSRARNVSEDTFGILTKRFRIFQRRLQLTQEHMIKVVLATCVLHNFLRGDSESLFSELQANDNDNNDSAFEDLRGCGGTFSGVALKIRDTFKDYFSSSNGAVEWQDKMINRGKKMSHDK